MKKIDTLSNCDHIPCPEKSIRDIQVVLYQISQEANAPTTIVPTSGKTINQQILKTEKLIIQKNGLIRLELNNDLEWYAIVAKELNFQTSNNSDSFIKIRWEDFDIDQLRGVDGDRGADAVNFGSNGESGKNGSHGGTKNSPDIYLFVGEVTVDNGSLNNIHLNFDLDGVRGGIGGKGGDGGNGMRGKDGRNARNDGPFCGRNASRGQDGGNGGFGGKGGNGGCGGAGPLVHINWLTSDVYDMFSSAKYSVAGGYNGKENGGRAGIAGKRGDGGSRGSYAGNCDRRVPDGSPGRPNPNNGEDLSWNLGHGMFGMDGKDGEVLIDHLENDNVFKNPV